MVAFKLRSDEAEVVASDFTRLTALFPPVNRATLGELTVPPEEERLNADENRDEATGDARALKSRPPSLDVATCKGKVFLRGVTVFAVPAEVVDGTALGGGA